MVLTMKKLRDRVDTFGGTLAVALALGCVTYFLLLSWNLVPYDSASLCRFAAWAVVLATLWLASARD